MRVMPALEGSLVKSQVGLFQCPLPFSGCHVSSYVSLRSTSHHPHSWPHQSNPQVLNWSLAEISNNSHNSPSNWFTPDTLKEIIGVGWHSSAHSIPEALQKLWKRGRQIKESVTHWELLRQASGLLHRILRSVLRNSDRSRNEGFMVCSQFWWWPQVTLEK